MSNVEDLFKALDNPATDGVADTEQWRPTLAGDQVGGVITRISSTASEYTTDEIPVIDIMCPDVTIRQVRAYHTVLRHELNARHLQVGDTVAIRYLGKLPTKDGRKTFHGYKVAHTPSDTP
jgi:hypothetical protein